LGVDTQKIKNKLIDMSPKSKEKVDFYDTLKRLRLKNT